MKSGERQHLLEAVGWAVGVLIYLFQYTLSWLNVVVLLEELGCFVTVSGMAFVI